MSSLTVDHLRVKVVCEVYIRGDYPRTNLESLRIENLCQKAAQEAVDTGEWKMEEREK